MLFLFVIKKLTKTQRRLTAKVHPLFKAAPLQSPEKHLVQKLYRRSAIALIATRPLLVSTYTFMAFIG